MKSQNFFITKYEADKGKVFDWANLEEHKITDDNGNEIQEHLYAKTLFIGSNDSIANYIEIDSPFDMQ
jgi:hypothetical protein